MKKCSLLFFVRTLGLLLLFSLANFSVAENVADATAGVGGDYQDIGDYRIFYTLFPSTFVPANIAASYGLKRSKYENVLNVFVAQKGEPGGIKSDISGTTKNLMQQLKPLTFQEIAEKDTVYYLAPVRITGEETMHFDITLTPKKSDKPLTLKFTKKVYAGN